MVAIKFIRGGKYGGIAWFGEFVQATLRTNKHVFRIRTMKFGKGGGPLSMTEIVVIGNFEFITFSALACTKCVQYFCIPK